MVDKISIREDRDKNGNLFQKMFVDFKQDIQTDESRQFFMNIQAGNNLLTYDNKQVWKAHFIPFARIRNEPPIVKEPLPEYLYGEGGGVEEVKPISEMSLEELKARYKFLYANKVLKGTSLDGPTKSVSSASAASLSAASL